MGDFSASEAIGSGFRLIARHPVAVLWWAGACLLVLFLPQLLILGAIAPAFLEFFRQTAHDAAAGVRPAAPTASMLALQSKMMVVQPLTIASGLVGRSLLMGAVFRGVLQPEDRRFGYLRLSGQELWLGLAVAVMWVMAVLLLVALMIPCIVVVAVMAMRAGHAAPSPWDVLALAVLLLAGVGAIVWVMLRLSMALPMCFAERKFLFFESWTLTRGHGLKIFGVWLALFVLVVLAEMLLGGLAFATFARGWAQGGAARWFEQDPAELARQAMLWLPIWAVVGSIVSALFFAVVAAPLADIYRQLTRSGGAV